MCEHIEECISAENGAVSAFGSLCWCAHQHKIPNTVALPVHQHSWLRPSTSQQSCPAPVPLVWPHWDWSWWGPAGTGSVWRPATSCALPWCLVCVKDEWEGWHLVPRPGPSCGERWVWAKCRQPLNWAMAQACTEPWGLLGLWVWEVSAKEPMVTWLWKAASFVVAGEIVHKVLSGDLV